MVAMPHIFDVFTVNMPVEVTLEVVHISANGRTIVKCDGPVSGIATIDENCSAKGGWDWHFVVSGSKLLQGPAAEQEGWNSTFQGTMDAFEEHIRGVISFRLELLDQD